MSPICEEIGRWAAGLTLGDVPERVAERARLQRENTLAAGLAGEAAAPFRAAAPDGPVGDLYMGAAASIAHDWDDYLFMGHTGHSSVWAAGAFCDGDEDALVAQIAANEVAGRLGCALFLGPHNGQFWASIHCASGAVAAGLGLGLDAKALGHAVAISLYQPPYGLWPGFMGPPTKLLTAAEPAMQGARAALLAAEGVRGPLEVIEDPRGFLTHLSFAPRPSMLGELGSVWLTDTLAFKPVPGCAYLQAAVEAALAAEVAPADVAEIRIEGGYLTCGMEALGRGPDLVPVRVNFSTALSVAVALVAGRLTHSEMEPAWLADHEAEVLELASRVLLSHDWDLTMRTVRAPLDAGLGLDDLGLGTLRRVRRRIAELNMGDEISFGLGDLAALLGRPDVLGELARGLRRRARRGGAARSPGLAGLDTARMRLTFPCTMEIRLRSGRRIEREGREPGSCGAPLDEQRAVVGRKAALVGERGRGDDG